VEDFIREVLEEDKRSAGKDFRNEEHTKQVIKAVFRVLKKHATEEEIKGIIRDLPKHLKEFFAD
jgi:uncharacterized protein (DUF2267 family)